MSSDELLPPTVEADTSPAIEKAPPAIEQATSSVTLATTTATVATAVAAATAAAEVEATAATTPPSSPSSVGTSAASSPSSEAIDTEVEAPVIEHTLTIPQASTVTPIAPAPTPAALADKHLLTFPEHLKRILNGFYTVNMRRSVQTCVLVEADRCLKMQYRRLKAFQRKVALHDTASDLVDTLSFIPPHQRLEIMYRTATSRVILSPELTWRRMKLIDREIKKNIIPKVMQLSEPGKTHDEICKLYLQKEYEKVSGKKDIFHPNWEYSHDNHFTAYRMFYVGSELDPSLPPARDPNPNRVVPSVKPRPEVVEAENLKRAAKAAAAALQASKDAEAAAIVQMQNLNQGQSNKKQKTAHKSSSVAKSTSASSKAKKADDDASERRALLKEIKDHLEILNEFKGIMPESELNERKRDLFNRLPKP